MRIIRNNGHLALIRGRLLNIHIIQHFTHTDRLNADSSHTKSTMIVFCSTVFRQILGLLKPIVYEDISSSIWTTFHRVQESTSSSSLTSEHSSKTKFFLFYLCLRGRKTEKTESQSQRAIEENIDPNHKLK